MSFRAEPASYSYYWNGTEVAKAFFEFADEHGNPALRDRTNFGWIDFRSSDKRGFDNHISGEFIPSREPIMFDCDHDHFVIMQSTNYGSRTARIEIELRLNLSSPLNYCKGVYLKCDVHEEDNRRLGSIFIEWSNTVTKDTGVLVQDAKVVDGWYSIERQIDRIHLVCSGEDDGTGYTVAVLGFYCIDPVLVGSSGLMIRTSSGDKNLAVGNALSRISESSSVLVQTSSGTKGLLTVPPINDWCSVVATNARIYTKNGEKAFVAVNGT